MKPIFSIITASFNTAKSIQRCINSVREQTFSQIEHLIVDGASQDGTVEIIENNSNNLTCWITEQDTGIYQAWNKALAHVKGEWLLFLGADDRLANPHAIERIFPYLEKAYPSYRVVYGKINLLNSSGRILETMGDPWNTHRGKYEHGRIKLPPHSGTFHHRSLFEQKGFDESLRIAGDSEFLIRELKNNPALFIPEIITDMTLGGISGSPQNALIRWRECRNIMKKHQIKIPLHILVWHRMKNISEFLIFSIFSTKTACRLADIFRQLIGRKKYWTK